ncbi:uncharacterized protein LOC124254288 isoform X2 [Haliotis rubra]|uniref:uncharacterized protein LOC124254288 isoform X2 n=1 Tax=Haliotis rubra TaxID=36100 RepID=UPI001EE61B34|nr:uncharacterized protein LOC124254288 isoform X2 [Haliotis rubra]
MSSVKIEDLEDDGSDDEQMKGRNASSPVDPKDSTMEMPSSSGTQMARLQNLNQNAIAQYTEDVRIGEMTEVKLANCPNTVVGQKVVINQNTPVVTRLDKIKVQTKRKLDKFRRDSYYETRAAKSAKECVKSGWVLLKGSEEYGKTSLGLYILKTFDQSYIPLYIQNQGDLECITDLTGLEDVKKDGKFETFVIFIDVPFKSHDEVDTHLTDAVELASRGAAHVIISISTKNLPKLEKSTLLKCQGKNSQHAVTLQDLPLQEHERYEILKQKLKPQTVKSLGPTEGSQEAALQDIAKLTDHPWFFMAIESSGSKKGTELVTSLKNPVGSFIQQLEHMAENEQMKFAALVMIVKDGFLYEAKNRPQDHPNLHNHFLKI